MQVTARVEMAGICAWSARYRRALGRPLSCMGHAWPSASAMHTSEHSWQRNSLPGMSHASTLHVTVWQMHTSEQSCLPAKRSHGMGCAWVKGIAMHNIAWQMHTNEHSCLPA